MKDGPTTYNLPAQTVTRCGSCRFHECIGSMHVRLGPGGWREYACSHPDAYEPVTDGDPKKAEIRGMLRAMDKHGRHIGRTETTPAWCPFTRKDQ